MPQVKTKQLLYLCFFVLLAFFTGCSERNAQSPINPDTGRHSVNWLPAPHMEAAKSGLDSCSSCHGADFKGGISGVSCTSCHLGSPTSVHPTDWVPVYSTHGPYAKTNSTTACANQYCHGTSLAGVTNSGPACVSCHVNGSYPFTTTGCVSCHGNPPDGAVYPNIAGKHAKHMQLNGITCAACHARSSDQHGNGTVEVIFDATYNAKSGAATYDPTTKKCSNISCHGSTRTQTAVPDYQTPQSTPGQTPDWITGTIDVNTQCTACHVFGTAAGNPENNSYWSGRHYVHVWDPNSGPQPKLDCTECHDTNKLAVNHLTALNTTIMEGPASATIVTNANYNGWDCSNASCHSDWGATW